MLLFDWRSTSDKVISDFLQYYDLNDLFEQILNHELMLQ